MPRRPGVPVLLGEQNVEHRLWSQRARTHADPVLREAELACARATARAEQAAWRRVDMCATVTEEDRATLAAEVPGLDVRVVPDGADHDCGLGDETPDGLEHLEGDGPLVAMVGNYAYAPSLDAARHLLDDVMPAVWRARPDARVLLVGNAPPAELTAEADGRVRATGRVASVRPFLEAADVMVSPLRFGGGVKVKMLEALHAGAAIVATPVAAQGLPEVEGSIRVEHDAAGLASAIAGLLDDAPSRERLRANARRFARELPTWREAADALAACYRELAGLTAPARRAA